MKNFGYFKNTDPVLSGIKFGNWGSRPYEYFWAATILDAKDKNVLDLGTGLPSEHNWFNFVIETLNSKTYCGIDFDSRMKNEEINNDKCEMQWMDMSDLKFEDNSFDLIYSISTFEHFDNEECFMKSIKETHRVCKKDALMIVTLDEIWNIYNKDPIHSAWNELEKILIKNEKYDNSKVSFGMNNFINLISEFFEPVELNEEDVKKTNANESVLYSPVWNSSVSYGIFKVKK